MPCAHASSAHWRRPWGSQCSGNAGVNIFSSKQTSTGVMVPMALKICLSGDFYPVWNLASSSTSCSLYSILISRVENYVLNGVMVIGLERLGKPAGEACTVCYRDTLMVYGGIRIQLSAIQCGFVRE